MSPSFEGKPDGRGVPIAIVVSRFNEFVTRPLLAGATACLERHGNEASDRTITWVPGAWEIPQAVAKLADPSRVEAIVALGAVIRGETPHFDYICAEAARGLGAVSRRSGIPVAFGVLTTDTVDQASARAGDGDDNKGWEAALSALEMADLFRRIRATASGE